MQLKDSDRFGPGMRQDTVIIEEKNSSGTVIHRYTKGKFLGKGGFAKCYELTSLENDTKYAVKVIEKASLTRSKAKEKLNSQIKIHRSLKSKHVVGFNHYFEDEENVYIVLELCSNQTLNELIKRRKRITEVEAKYYVHQIASGVKDIHSNGVIHRDLKLGNLFLTDKLDVKIGDFGLAAKLSYDAERRKTMCGTPNYIAPEILENHNGHSYEVDVWSLGVIAYAFVVGRPPFETNDVKTTYSKIKNCNYSFPDGIHLSSTVKRFITKMLVKDPSRRATIDEILNDSFFTEAPFPKILPLSLAACPPNSAFLKQYSETTTTALKSSFENQAISTSREKLQRKDSQDFLQTDRRSDKDKDSTGRVLVRASSNDRVEHKHHIFQRASSTNALMANKRDPLPKQVIVPKSGQSMSPQLWVTYYEQNPKFGVCYLLNSNATGMRFNDSTFIVSNYNFTYVKYYGNLRENPNGETYEVGKTPETLNKKMKIISHYHKELRNRKQQDQIALTNDQRINREKNRFKEIHESAMAWFVVKHIKTSKVNIFWFNNKDYQVVFKDLTEILVSRDKYAVFVNKLAQRKEFLLSELADQTDDIKKRVNHTLTLIQNIRQSNAQRNSENESNKENNPTSLVRSSSMVKMEMQQPVLKKSSSTTSRLASYRLK